MRRFFIEARNLRRYDALVVDMTRQEQRLKQRIGQLDRSKLAAETRLGDCQRSTPCQKCAVVPRRARI